MAFRAHPYSQTQSQKKPSVRRQETNENSRPAKLNRNISANYDYQSYANPISNTKPVYPTLLQDNRKSELKGILKNRTNVQPNSKQTDNLKWIKENSNKTKLAQSKDSNEGLKIFTGTTKSVKFFTEMFETNENNKLKRKPSVGQFLFQLYGELDSTVSKLEESNKCIFTIKDSYDRIRCSFYEIDREMVKVPRSSFIRCLGKYNSASGEFRCVSIRVATQNELLNSGHLVSQTNSYIKSKYC